MKAWALCAAVVLGSAAAAAAQPAGTPSPAPPLVSPAPAPTNGDAATPIAATPVPTSVPGTQAPVPRPASSALPAASPTPAYNFVYRATPTPASAPLRAADAPHIDEIDLSDATIVTPGAIHVRVLTSGAVTSVVAQTFGRSIAIPQRSSGIFALDANVSSVPAFLKNRSYAIEFVATVADGRTANVTLPLVIK